MSLAVDVGLSRGGFALRAAFRAAAGETLALLGPNGSGKSTLVSCLAGLLPPEEGSIVLDGLELDDASTNVYLPPEQRSLGVVFQDLFLFPHLSVLENVSFPLRARGWTRAEAHVRARRLLEQLDIAATASARPPSLSGGQAQRVALARALASEPSLLLLDEPLSALDVSARGRLRLVLRRELTRFEGVRVLVTHDPVEAMTLADRLVLLEGGRVTQIGSPDEIRSAPRTPYAADLVGLNFFTGRLEPLDAGAGRLVTDAGEVVVPWPEAIDAGTEGVIGLLRPSDVVLHVERPEGSARNTLSGRVEGIDVSGERARVRLTTAPPLVAEVTLGSLERLGIVEGATLWASFKAVEVDVLPP